MRWLSVVVALAACGDDTPYTLIVDAPVDGLRCFAARTSVCNPLTQSGCANGEKCTWHLNALEPIYIGHVGCAPAGSAAEGEPCMYERHETAYGCASSYDNCAVGLVCGDYRGAVGVCKQLCDQQGGMPSCADDRVCVTYPNLFSTGSTTPAAAGVCDPACDPLADNDFDGSGSGTKLGSACGADGCYGVPSYGTAPRTGWSCRAERAPSVALFHRTECTSVTGCAEADGTIYIASCSQGYLPLLYESTGSTTVVCVALCKPLSCHAGNCGSNDENRLGEAPHRCTNPDRQGTFNTAPDGEHCQFLWWRERADDGSFLPSPTSDSVGVCMDFSKYQLDTDGDAEPDTPMPACATLPDGFGSGSALGAADLGCVDSSRLSQAKQVRRPVLDSLRILRRN